MKIKFKKKKMKFFIFILFIYLAIGCHPQCRYACDDPVCNAVCSPVCEKPRCELQLTPEGERRNIKINGEKPDCMSRCANETCESDSCPQCEVTCKMTTYGCSPYCEPLCEQLSCHWHCMKPSICPKPRCELVCEKPSCELPFMNQTVPTTENDKQQNEVSVCDVFSECSDCFTIENCFWDFKRNKCRDASLSLINNYCSDANANLQKLSILMIFIPILFFIFS